MSDEPIILSPEDFRIQPHEVKIGPYSYMKGHPPFLRTGIGMMLNYGFSVIRGGEKIKFFEIPRRPYIFKVNELVNATPDGLFETTLTPNLRAIFAHASMHENGLWVFASGVPVVAGVEAWNNAYPQEPVNLVIACQSERIDPASVDIAPFSHKKGVMSVYAGLVNAGFGLTESGEVVGVIKFEQFPDLPAYLADLPTFEI